MSTVEHAGKITVKGNPVTLVGDLPEVGQKAPDFTLTATDMSAKSLEDFGNKVKVILTLGSLDTSTCDTEVRRFNQEAGALGEDVAIIPVSVDLPMAQKRWCGAADVSNVECLSDYKDHSFGKQWGVRVKEAGLLARSVFVLDRDNTVRYVQLVDELSEEPDYDAALAAVRDLI